MNPQVSIVITSYNNRPFIEEAIASCFLDKGVQTEVIVVDDGSSDGSPELLRKLKERYQFELLARQENRGMTAARNIGIAMAKGRYLCILDGDDYLLPGKLEKQAQIMEAESGVVVCFCDAKLLRETSFLPFKLSEIWPPHDGSVLAAMLGGSFIAIHSAMFRFDRADLRFNENLSAAADYDLFLRLAERGPYQYLDQPLVVYRRSRKSNTIRNRLRVIHDTRTILEAWSQKELSPEQRAALDEHKANVLRQELDFLIQSRNRRATTFYDSQRSHISLSQSQRLILPIIMLLFRASPSLGGSLYAGLRSLQQAFSPHSRMAREFEG